MSPRLRSRSAYEVRVVDESRPPQRELEYTLPISSEPRWHDKARCAGRVTATIDPWFNDPGFRAIPEAEGSHFRRGSAFALGCCARCPVRKPCLEEALGLHVRNVSGTSYAAAAIFGAPAEFGIFAGVLASERKDKTADDVDDLLDMAMRRALDLGLAPTWAAGVEPVSAFVVGIHPGPGRGRKGPAALMADRLGISVRTARRRLKAAA